MRNWLITKDHINNGESADSLHSSEAQLVAKNGTAFRLYDDGELYYEGRMIMNDDTTGFEPLDWASSNAGCTSIKLFENGKWSTL